MSRGVEVDVKRCQEVAHCCWLMSRGVSSWSELPWSPKLILPIPSRPKHIEKELDVRPFCAKMLGTETSSIPSPKRPLGAAASRNDPVCVCPQLMNKK